MRQIFPRAAADVDLVEAYGRLSRIGPRRPAVRVNMIESLDGAAAHDGKSGGLGGAADRAVFAVLRSQADVVLVGAGTVRSEKYGPARLDEGARDRRVRSGLAPVPPIAVLTNSCWLDWDSALFSQPEQRPVVITTSAADPSRRARAAVVADVVVAGEQHVDLGEALAACAQRGYDNVLAEGGPSVIAQLAASGLIDELCLTVSPLLAAGDSGRILAGPALAPPARLGLSHVLEADSYLFLRYRRINRGELAVSRGGDAAEESR